MQNTPDWRRGSISSLDHQKRNQERYPDCNPSIDPLRTLGDAGGKADIAPRLQPTEPVSANDPVVASTSPAARFIAVVGTDFDAALREVATIRKAFLEADEEAYPPIEAEMFAASDYVLAMPIRCAKDARRKAEFAARYLHWGQDLQTVLIEIASFGSPAVASTIAPAELF